MLPDELRDSDRHAITHYDEIWKILKRCHDVLRAPHTQRKAMPRWKELNPCKFPVICPTPQPLAEPIDLRSLISNDPGL